MTATAAARQDIGDNRPPLITLDQLTKDFAHVEQFVSGLETEAASAPLVLEDDEDLEIVNILVPKLRRSIEKADNLREETKRPYLDAGNTVQAFFKGLAGRLAKVRDDLENRGTRYLNKKAEAERKARQAVEQAARAEAARKQAEADAAAKAGQKVEATAAAEQAQAAHNRADDAAQAQGAKPADLARTRTGAGTATLQDVWEFKIENFNLIEIERIKTYFSPSEIENAISRFVKAGGRDLAGVKIYSAPKARFT